MNILREVFELPLPTGRGGIMFFGWLAGLLPGQLLTTKLCEEAAPVPYGARRRDRSQDFLGAVSGFVDRGGC